MTNRLYYHDPKLLEFTGTITQAHTGEHLAIELDQSAFYPTSGGQRHDTGWIEAESGERLRVIQVEEESGHVVHYLEADALKIPPGAKVHAVIDAGRRRDHMQQHSGQHVLSAAFIELFDMPTVSFHMGDESCTIDLQTPGLTETQMEQAERRANEIVMNDVPVGIRFSSLAEAQTLGLRKIPPDVGDELRLIDIQGVDLTACGGTHVSRTGEIGAILLRKFEKVKQGMRVEFVCGERAVRTARRDFSTLTAAAALFSAQIYDVPAQITKLQEENKTVQKQEKRTQEEVAELMASQLTGEAQQAGSVMLVRRFFPERDVTFVKLLAQKLTTRPNLIALLAGGAGQPGVVFAQSAGGPFNVGALLKDALAPVGGRGGGSKDLAQGGVPDAAAAEQVLAAAAERIRPG